MFYTKMRRKLFLSTFFRHVGHFPLCLYAAAIHRAQNTCPQRVDVAFTYASKHIAHLPTAPAPSSDAVPAPSAVSPPAALARSTLSFRVRSRCVIRDPIVGADSDTTTISSSSFTATRGRVAARVVVVVVVVSLVISTSPDDALRALDAPAPPSRSSSSSASARERRRERDFAASGAGDVRSTTSIGVSAERCAASCGVSLVIAARRAHRRRHARCCRSRAREVAFTRASVLARRRRARARACARWMGAHGGGDPNADSR